MKRKKNILLILSTAIAYLFVIISIVNLHIENGTFLVIAFAAYCSIIMVTTYNLYKKDLKEMSSLNLNFKKNFPMRHYGTQLTSFHHVFTFELNILKELLAAIDQNVVTNNLLSELKEVHFTDIDRELRNPQSKSFYCSSSEPSVRESVVTLALHVNNCGKMQNIRWWLLLHGFTDWNKVFALIAFSPITLLFWIGPYLKKEYDLINQVRKISTSFYDDIEVVSKVKSINNAVFNALVDFLDSYEVDTSDLKMQRAQVLNITVSGGKTQFGNIVQGGINKVFTANRGGK